MISTLPRPRPLAVALATLLAAPGTALATPDPDASAAEREPVNVESVEVTGARPGGYGAPATSTATRTDTPLRDVSQSVTVVTRKLIEDQAMHNLADVVRYVPGVGMAQGEGNRDTPILRGNSSTADMFVDGMRDDVQYFRDLYNIERVEALKGPNAMIFGRGGSGGLLNRVTREADWNEHNEIGLQLGSWARRRLTADSGQGLNDASAFRITGLVEDSESFRDGYEARRWGVNPTLALRAGEATTLRFGYEHFRDERTADRGISSWLGRPLDTDPSTFFGDPGRSPTWAEVDAFNALVEHDFGDGVLLRNRTRYAAYDKFYQNVFPGAVQAGGTRVAIQAYNNATQRDNLFNQTDLIWDLQAGAVGHRLLIGAEFGRQVTDNFRETGYFTAVGINATSDTVDVANPIYTGPIQFRQSASDADNHSVARSAALFVQDQIEFGPHWQAIVGLRYDRFEAELLNNRNGSELAASDDLLSPRLGLLYKPFDALSFYGSYSLAFVPRAGEQLASLSATNAALDPERFTNLELGAKWDIHSALSFTAAVYRLDRGNVAVVDPDDSTRLVLLPGDAQRVRGLELGLSGNLTRQWQVMAGYAWQDGEIVRDIRTSPTALIPAGTTLAQLPRHSLSLWNRYDLDETWGLGLGATWRSAVYASTSNVVELPGYTRVDAAVYFALSETMELQLNIENLFDREYYVSAHSDTNISPGSPRAFYLGISTRF